MAKSLPSSRLAVTPALSAELLQLLRGNVTAEELAAWRDALASDDPLVVALTLSAPPDLSALVAAERADGHFRPFGSRIDLNRVEFAELAVRSNKAWSTALQAFDQVVLAMLDELSGSIFTDDVCSRSSRERCLLRCGMSVQSELDPRVHYRISTSTLLAGTGLSYRRSGPAGAILPEVVRHLRAR